VAFVLSGGTSVAALARLDGGSLGAAACGAATAPTYPITGARKTA